MTGMIDHIQIGKGGKKAAPAYKAPEQCDNCRFYLFQECRKNAPIVLTEDVMEHNIEGKAVYVRRKGYAGEWPNVQWNGWCGQYERKPDDV